MPKRGQKKLQKEQETEMILLENKKQKIKTLVGKIIAETMDTMPAMVQTIVQMNLSSVYQLVDGLSVEQIDGIIKNVRGILDEIESNEPVENDYE